MVSRLRQQRIAERIQEELAELLVFEVADPRLEGITVTDVRVDRELGYADVYVSALEGAERAPEVLAGLDAARGFLRKMLAQRIPLRVFPRLRFHWDPTPERADRIEALLARLRAEREQRAASGEAADESA